MVVWFSRMGALMVCYSLVFVLVFTLAHENEKSGKNFSNLQLQDLHHDYGKVTSRTEDELNNFIKSTSTCKPKNLIIDVAAAVCGDRIGELMNMARSILIFTKHVHFHIVAEMELQGSLKRYFESYPPSVRMRFNYTIYNLSFPKEDSMTWKKLFKTCACQRLFLMNVIPRDNVLYLDTDTLLVSPVEYIWNHFHSFNESHLAALTPEGAVAVVNWYHIFARHPYYGKFGVNTGVMLMDLKKMREIKFDKKIVEIYQEYKLRIKWGDQDLLNIFFYQHPEMLYVYPCEWNYRPDQCIYLGNDCPTAEQNGVYVIHGNRGAFHVEKQLQPTFKAMFDIISEYKFNENIKTAIIGRAWYAQLFNITEPHCRPMITSFVKNMLGATKL